MTSALPCPPRTSPAEPTREPDGTGTRAGRDRHVGRRISVGPSQLGVEVDAKSAQSNEPTGQPTLPSERGLVGAPRCQQDAVSASGCAGTGVPGAASGVCVSGTVGAAAPSQGLATGVSSPLAWDVP